MPYGHGYSPRLTPALSPAPPDFYSSYWALGLTLFQRLLPAAKWTEDILCSGQLVEKQSGF